MSLYRADEVYAETMQAWERGLPPGYSPGWPSVEKLYTVAPGQWTLVTGVPGSGKSEWLDAMMVNLARRDKWRFFVYSPENRPVSVHAAKLAEKYLGKPFGKGPTERMEKDELDEALQWIERTWKFSRADDSTLAGILAQAQDQISIGATWMTGVVIDPWNYVDHAKGGLSEADYLSAALGDLIRFIDGNAKRDHGGQVHVWVVAHPKIMQKSKDGAYPIPKPYDIAGGAHWWNKADNCLCIHRNQGEGSQEVDIHVQKIRQKHIGRIGVATLHYDRVTGRYHEPLAAVPSKGSVFKRLREIPVERELPL